MRSFISVVFGLCLSIYGPGVLALSTSYTDLRALPGSSEGQVENLNANLIGGTFNFSSTDPYGNDDDNGIVIAAPNGFWTRQFTYSAASPIELDWFELANNDDITSLLTTLATTYGDLGNGYNELYLNAPSVPLTLESGYINWDDGTLTSLDVKRFSFLENGAAVTIQHIENSVQISKYKLWQFNDYLRVLIGGTNLDITFQSNHPGLGTGGGNSPIYGLISLSLDRYHVGAELVDFRANVRDTHSVGLSFYGYETLTDPAIHTSTLTTGRVLQANIAGEFWASGININSGVVEAWYDPNNTWITDPYNVSSGWDGAVVKRLGTDFIWHGRKIGCYDTARNQGTIRGVFTQRVDKLTGGVTLEYGTPTASIFQSNAIGNSATDRYIVRYKDYGSSGPTALTGLPEGVAVHKLYDSGIMKNDPAFTYGHTGPDFRFLRFEELPSDFGNGLYPQNINQANFQCAPGNLTNNDQASGTPYIWRGEASSDGSNSPFETAYFDIEFHNVDASTWVHDTYQDNHRTMFAPAGSGADVTPNGIDRSWGHIMRATTGTFLPFTAHLSDTNEVTGGAWENIQIQRVLATGNTGLGTTDTVVPAQDNYIHDTVVFGEILVGVTNIGQIRTPVYNTRIENVDIICGKDGLGSCPTGDVVIEIAGTTSDVHLVNVSAPTNMRIEGTAGESPATVEINGVNFGLPFIFGTSDTDADGVFAEVDNCPINSNGSQLDTDSDTLGNECDQDDDNDGLSDALESSLGTNTLLIDTDGDSYTDGEEVTAGSNPLDSASTPVYAAPLVGPIGLALALFSMLGLGWFRIRSMS